MKNLLIAFTLIILASSAFPQDGLGIILLERRDAIVDTIYWPVYEKKYTPLPAIDTFNLVQSAGRPIIELYSKGEPMLFLLDTGSSRSIINQSLVKDLGFKLKGRAGTTRGLTDQTVPTYWVEGADFTSSNGVLVDLRWVSLNMTDVIKTVKGNTGQDIVGIIGYDFFRQYIVTAHFSQGLIIAKKLTSFDGEVHHDFRSHEERLRDMKKLRKKRKKQERRNNI